MPKGAPSGGGGGGKSEKVQKAQRSAKKGTQKGRTRHFTSPEELAAQAAQLGEDPRDRVREPKADGDTSEDETSTSGSGSESDDSAEKTKGVEALIEIENPNRVIAKSKKISELTLDDTSGAAAPQLTRREREEIEKEKQKKHFEQLRAEGKTDQARADLARLAIIRQEREAAAKKREVEQKAKDAARGAKQDSTPSLKKDAPAGGVSAVPPSKK